MSLLIAANLVDRVYMCADTRLSKIIEKDGVTTYERLHDNQLKVVHFRENVIVGCVGSPALGAFLTKKIKDVEGSPVYIRDLRKWLEDNEAQIKIWLHEYLAQPPQTEMKYGNCVLLFAGQDPRRPRKIEGAKLFQLTQAYQDASQLEFNNLFGGKPIEEFTQAELGRFTYEAHKSRMGLKHVILEGITHLNGASAKEIEIRVPDQLIFALEVNAANAYYSPNQIITFKNFEWGETPVYGASFNPSILPTTFFGILDLNMNAGEEWNDLVPFMAKIHEKFSERTIGGTITNMILKDAAVNSLTGTTARMEYPNGPAEVLVETSVIGGEVHHKNSGIWSRLIPFTEAKKADVDGAILAE